MSFQPTVAGCLLGLLAVTSSAPPTGAQGCGAGCQVLPQDAASGTRFGSSVAIHGAVAAASSPEADSVTVFKWGLSEWKHAQRIPCPECPRPEGSGLFGLSIALHDDHLAVGAPFADRGGLVFRFQRTRDSYSGVPPWLAPDAPDEGFGWSVAVGDGFLVVGAPRANDSRGEVYVYDQEGRWLANLSGQAAGDQFGISVALDRASSVRGRLLAVGAPFAEGTGVVFLYELTQGSAPPNEPLTVLRPSDGLGLDAFGFAVAVDNGTVLVGSPQHDDRGSNSGAVYFYRRNAASWEELETTGSDQLTDTGDQLGIAVALQGNGAVAGARRHDGAARDGGAIVRFERDGSTWNQTQRWLGEPQPGAELGIAVALDDVSVLAGAYLGNDGAGAAYALGEETDLAIHLDRRGGAETLRLKGKAVYRVKVQNQGPQRDVRARLRVERSPKLRSFSRLACEDPLPPCSQDEGPSFLGEDLDLEMGRPLTRCFLACVAPDARGEVRSTASIELPVGIFDENGGNVDSQSNEIESRSLVTSIPAKSNPVVVVPGEVAAFTFVVRNLGEKATGATFAVHFEPAGLAAISVRCRPAGDGSLCDKRRTFLPESGVFTDTVDISEHGRIEYTMRARVKPPIDGTPSTTLSASIVPPEGIVNLRASDRCSEPQAHCTDMGVLVAEVVCPFGDACDGEFQIDTMGNELYPTVAGNLRELALVWLDSPASLDAPPTGQRIVGRRLVPGAERGKADLGRELEVSAGTGSFGRSAADLDDSGNFAVVWESFDFSDPFGHNLRARRFKAGAALGEELVIAPSTGEYQRDPDLSLSPDGGFVVVWADRSPPDIVGHRYSSGGEPQGSEFLINTYTTGPQGFPALATDEDGNFIVVWTSGYLHGSGQDGSGSTIRGRRFAPDGRPRGDEFQISASTGSQTQPDVAVGRDGDFVVVWTDEVVRTPFVLGLNIEARRFSSDGRALGEKLKVNSDAPPGYHRRPRVATGAGGQSFLVVWERFSLDKIGFDGTVRGRRFASDGTPLEEELPLSASTTDSQSNPAVSQGADGFFAVWSSDASRDDVAVPTTSVRGKRISSEPGDP